LGQSGLPELEDDECTLQSSVDLWSLLLTLRFFMRLLTRGASIGEEWMAALLRRREIFAQIDFARRRRVIRIGLFITFCWVLSGNTAAAQQSSAEPSKPSPTNPVPTPIPLAEVASQAQSAMESLRHIEDSLSADQTTTTVEKRLPHLTKEIDLRTAYHVKLLAASLPLESHGAHFADVS
jgi:hypothetical protein